VTAARGNLVAAVPEGPVLFAYDGFEDARAAIRHAGRQLSDGRAAIVLTVWEPFKAMPFASTPTTPGGLEQTIEREARRVADEGARLARAHGFAARAVAERGASIWKRIVQSADEHNASMVVLGAHGRTGTQLLALGSVVVATVEHTARPVLIVHAPPRALAA
jgi:nucleotide-binding universal stress UspA family protein